MTQEIATPSSIEEIIDLIKSRDSVIPRGGGSKPSLSQSGQDTTILDMRNVSGIVEYQSSEYTITVKGGTSLREVVSTLKSNGQYLPFDPPLASVGATIGGTVAAGLSGAGAYRYGPLKDFIIGVRFIDGMGNLVRGGGKVVKNAAGFDFPKLFNGSMGRLGILTEVSFKVFPEPTAYVILIARCESLEEALTIIPSLKGYDLEGVELDSGLNLFLRLGYQESTMESRKRGLESLMGKSLKMIIGEDESDSWKSFKDFDSFRPYEKLFKTVTHPASALKFLKELNSKEWKSHLTNGGKTIYLGGESTADVNSLESTLKSHHLPGMQLRGDVAKHPLIGYNPGLSFVNRVQKALDPQGVFLPFTPKRLSTAR